MKEAATPDRYHRSGPGADDTLARLLQARTAMGITRIADLTGLDRLGIPVVQVVRPFSCSNAVAQGKGANLTQAAISAIFECAEACFAERIERYDVTVSTADALGVPQGWFDGHLQANADAGWRQRDIMWVSGEDLLSGDSCLLPLELVHTDYRFPQSPLEGTFVSSTTGLAASLAEGDAIIHGMLECIERDAIARALNTHGFFQNFRIDTATITDTTVLELIDHVESKGMLVGLWQVESPVNLPVVWCHVMECNSVNPLLPFPADGSAASLEPAAAIVHAIYEAAQTRLAAISGARDDITRASYPKYPDRERLGAHRRLLSEGPCTRNYSELVGDGETMGDLLAVLERSGISNALLVKIDTTPVADLSVVKILIPPLQPLLEH